MKDGKQKEGIKRIKKTKQKTRSTLKQKKRAKKNTNEALQRDCLRLNHDLFS